MAALTRLLDFFHDEIAAEERAGFPRLTRVPDSRVIATLGYYRSLSDDDRRAFRDCCAHWAHACYGFVVGAAEIDHTRHPFFQRWLPFSRSAAVGRLHSVPLMRAMVQQYKIDAHRGVRSCVSPEEFEVASSVHSVKAPELRKRVRAALKPLGYYKLDELGCYRCRRDGREFRVDVDYGGRGAQLRYYVAFPEYENVRPLNRFSFERALGFGQGDWDYIVEENVDDALPLFADLVDYCVSLPDRIRQASE